MDEYIGKRVLGYSLPFLFEIAVITLLYFTEFYNNTAYGWSRTNLS
jgi:hypothetical protein